MNNAYIAIQVHSHENDSTRQWSITKQDDIYFKVQHSDGACVLDERHLREYIEAIADHYNESSSHDVALVNNIGLIGRSWTADDIMHEDFDTNVVFRALDILKKTASVDETSEERKTGSLSDDRPEISIFINDKAFIILRKGDESSTFIAHNFVYNKRCSFHTAVAAIWVDAACNMEEAFIDSVQIINNFGLPTSYTYDGIDLNVIKRYLFIMMSCNF